MTSRSAGTPVFAGIVIHRHGPIAEIHGILDMVRPVRIRMHFMTCAAGSALRVLIHMHEMKIFSAVSEIGRFVRTQLRKRRFVVTGKTNAIFPFGVGSVKIRRIIFCQYPPIIRAVRIMTADAIRILDRAVAVLACLQIRFHIQDIALFGRKFLVMARQTKLELLLRQKFREVRKMRIMAVHAEFWIAHRAVFYEGPLGEGGFVRVTVRTD